MPPRMSRWLACAAFPAVAFAAAAVAVPSARAQERSRDEWQKTQQIFAAMGVHEGAAVADVGAGNGYLTTRLAAAVGPDGRVYAVDVSRAALERLRLRLQDEEIGNVTVIEGAPDDPRLPAGTLDAAVIVNAYHEMHEHQAMLAAIRTALKPDGRLVIVEPISENKRGQARAELARVHQMAPEYVLAEARTAGFRIVGLEDPFTARPHDTEWMLVLQPDATAPAEPNLAREPRPALPDIDDPSLRITIEDFEALRAQGGVTVLDVRDSRSFERGHLPGARLLPLSDLAGAARTLAALGNPIVTYCS